MSIAVLCGSQIKHVVYHQQPIISFPKQGLGLYFNPIYSHSAVERELIFALVWIGVCVSMNMTPVDLLGCRRSFSTKFIDIFGVSSYKCHCLPLIVSFKSQPI